MKFLFSEISRHWHTLTDNVEQKILKDYGQDGRIIALGYISTIDFFNTL